MEITKENAEQIYGYLKEIQDAVSILNSESANIQSYIDDLGSGNVWQDDLQGEADKLRTSMQNEKDVLDKKVEVIAGGDNSLIDKIANYTKQITEAGGDAK